MSHYLIEFRFFGKAKREIKRLILEVDKKFSFGRRKRPVPHISLAGPFETKNQRRLLSDFRSLCEKHNLMHFTVEGYGYFLLTRVIFINIKPDKEFDLFRWKLSKTLQLYCSLKPYDLKRKFEYHATIARNLPLLKFIAVKLYIDKKSKPNFKHALIRATLTRDSKILCEYDFLLKRLLNRREAKSRTLLKKTFRKLKQT